jgi:hypothetical protein
MESRSRLCLRLREVTVDELSLRHDDAIQAAEMFLMAIREELADDPDGRVPLSRAIELLRDSFETIKVVFDPPPIGGFED